MINAIIFDKIMTMKMPTHFSKNVPEIVTGSTLVGQEKPVH